jgi:hypothetical protein
LTPGPTCATRRRPQHPLPRQPSLRVAARCLGRSPSGSARRARRRSQLTRAQIASGFLWITFVSLSTGRGS